MNNEKLLSSFIWIEPLDQDMFSKVRETLTRIGIVSKVGDVTPTLWQTAHILHKQGSYAIVHFKQLFLLDGKTSKTDFTAEDEARLRLIVNLLQKWKMITPKKPVYSNRSVADVTVVQYKDKPSWNLRSKYFVGKRHIDKLDDPSIPRNKTRFPTLSLKNKGITKVEVTYRKK